MPSKRLTRVRARRSFCLRDRQPHAKPLRTKRHARSKRPTTPCVWPLPQRDPPNVYARSRSCRQHTLSYRRRCACSSNTPSSSHMLLSRACSVPSIWLLQPCSSRSPRSSPISGRAMARSPSARPQSRLASRRCQRHCRVSSFSWPIRRRAARSLCSSYCRARRR